MQPQSPGIGPTGCKLAAAVALREEPSESICSVLAAWATTEELKKKVGVSRLTHADLIVHAFDLLGISNSAELSEQLLSNGSCEKWMATRDILLTSITEELADGRVDEADAKQALQVCRSLLARVLRRFSLQVYGLCSVAASGHLMIQPGSPAVPGSPALPGTLAIPDSLAMSSTQMLSSAMPSSPALPRGRKRSRSREKSRCQEEEVTWRRRRITCKSPDLSLLPASSAGHRNLRQTSQNATKARAGAEHSQSALKTHPDKAGDSTKFLGCVTASEISTKRNCHQEELPQVDTLKDVACIFSPLQIQQPLRTHSDKTGNSADCMSAEAASGASSQSNCHEEQLKQATSSQDVASNSSPALGEQALKANPDMVRDSADFLGVVARSEISSQRDCCTEQSQLSKTVEDIASTSSQELVIIPLRYREQGKARARDWWLPGLQFVPGLERCLDLADLNRFGATCVDARGASDTEVHHRLRRFALRADDFKPRMRLSANGRLIRDPSCRYGSDTARRVKSFLGCPRHMRLFESLDLSNAPISALACLEVQAIFRKMPQLEEVIVPWNGWGTPGERLQFIKALPKHVNFRCIGTDGLVYSRRDEFSMRLRRESRSFSARPAQAGDGFVGLRELIPGWDRMGPDLKREMHQRMRKAVHDGAIPAKTGSRWQWAPDDPSLPRIRQYLADADFISPSERRSNASSASSASSAASVGDPAPQ